MITLLAQKYIKRILVLKVIELNNSSIHKGYYAKLMENGIKLRKGMR